MARLRRRDLAPRNGCLWCGELRRIVGLLCQDTMLNENFRDMLLALNDACVEFLLVGAYVFQIGVPPQRIDILTTISGVQFEEAWKNRLTVEIEGITVAVLGLQDLLLNKQLARKQLVGKDSQYISIARKPSRIG